MPFLKSKRNICQCIRRAYRDVLLNCDDKTIESLRPKFIKIYIDAKKMNRKLNWYAHDGKLPNPDSPGWREDFWEKQFRQLERLTNRIKRKRNV